MAPPDFEKSYILILRSWISLIISFNLKFILYEIYVLHPKSYTKI
jgi:hypothetical protein